MEEELTIEKVRAAIAEIAPDFDPVPCRLTGEDGNAWAIIGRVVAALKRCGFPALVPIYRQFATADSYEWLLAVSCEFAQDIGGDDGGDDEEYDEDDDVDEGDE